MTPRTANTADLPVIRAIAEAAYAPYIAVIGKKPAPMVADFSGQIAEGSVRVVGESSVAGFAVSYPRGQVWHIENLAVSPPFQGPASAAFFWPMQKAGRSRQGTGQSISTPTPP